MNRRCYDVTERGHKDYGARGIFICEGWRDSFESFDAQMGEPPAGKSIDRIDNDSGYTCGQCADCVAHGWVANCRWATAKEQANNRRSNRK
jgi:hypothetical protein